MKNKVMNVMMMILTPFFGALCIKGYFPTCTIGCVSIFLLFLLVRFWGNIISFIKNCKYVKLTQALAVMSIFVGVYFGDIGRENNTLWFLFVGALGVLWILFVLAVQCCVDEEEEREEEIVIKNPSKKEVKNDDDDEDVVFP